MAVDSTGAPTSLGIPTYATGADAPSGKGFNATMAVIDGLFQTRVTVASNSVWKNKLLSSDTQPAFQINGDGKVQWGAGGSSAVDTTLFRASSAFIQTDGAFAALWFVATRGSTGAASGVITPTGTFTRVTSSDGGNISTINGGADGRILILMNASGSTLTFVVGSNIAFGSTLANNTNSIWLFDGTGGGAWKRIV